MSQQFFVSEEYTYFKKKPISLTHRSIPKQNTKTHKEIQKFFQKHIKIENPLKLRHSQKSQQINRSLCKKFQMKSSRSQQKIKKRLSDGLQKAINNQQKVKNQNRIIQSQKISSIKKQRKKSPSSNKKFIALLQKHDEYSSSKNLHQKKFTKVKKKLSQPKLNIVSRKNLDFKSDNNSFNKKLKKESNKSKRITTTKQFFDCMKKNKTSQIDNFIKKFYKNNSLYKEVSFNKKSKNGDTVMHFSVQNENLNQINFLKDLGQNFDIQNKEGITPIMKAAHQGNLQILKYLLQSTDNINQQDNEGNTILHFAAISDNEEICQYLIEKTSINPSIKNNQNRTFLEILKPSLAIKFKQLLLDQNSIQDDPYNNNLKINAKQIKINHIFSTETDETIQKLEKNIDISQFIIHSRIGKGSFGEVYLVERKDQNCYYAMKVLNKKKIFQDNLKKYAITERNVLCQIEHPFIVKLRYAFQNNSYLFLIMDYYPGGNLAEYLEKEGFFSENKSKIYLAEIILAIEELHRNNIIFRDLKPENIVIDKEGHALLIDFGLSKQNINKHNKGAKSFCGSIAYLAPEMIEKKGHGKSIDWYLLGVLLYEMLIGIPPFYDDSKEQLFHNIQKQKLELPSYFSEEVKDLLNKLLSKNPNQRLGSFNGAEDIKNHPWFKGYNWIDVLNKKLKPSQPKSKKLKLFALKKSPKFLNNSQFSQQQPINGWTFIETPKQFNQIFYKKNNVKQKFYKQKFRFDQIS